MNKLYVFLFLLLITLSAFAQSNYRPGLIITLKTDTVKGFIDYREWDNNPGTIRFKTKMAEANVETFKASDILGFAVNNLEIYESQTVRISMDDVHTERLSTGIDTSSKTVKVFLRALQKGVNVTLFSFTDEVKTRYFTRSNPNPAVVELIFKIYQDADQHTSIITKNTYQQQLIVIAHAYGKDSPELNRSITQMSYGEKEITKVITALNGGDQKVTQPTTNKHSIELFTGVAIDMAILKYEGYSVLANPSGNSASFFPRLAFGFDVFTNPSVGRSFFRLEAALSGSNFTNTGTDYSAFGVGQATQTTKEYTVSFIPQAFYNFYKTDALTVFAGVGVAFNLSSINSQYHYQNTGFSVDRSDYSRLENFWTNFPFKVGATINKKIEIFACYAPKRAATLAADYMGYITVSEAGFYYCFGGGK